jgi:L-galactono-1,4-lactone dehydrogenase
MTFSQLRDVILDYAPLDLAAVKRANKAEAQFWTLSSGYRADISTNILGFDCGGQQWVLEVCVPLSNAPSGSNKDLMLVKRILQRIEERNIPAHTPIEQRWTASSTAFMSPAYGQCNDKFTWVGIIMYLPPGQSVHGREEITQMFRKYCDSLQDIFDEFGAQVHWAKLEALDATEGRSERVQRMQSRIRRRFPIDKFNELRKRFDREGVLSNAFIREIFD